MKIGSFSRVTKGFEIISGSVKLKQIYYKYIIAGKIS